ncbi:MAG: ferrous iron transport protein B [Clostridia bacterium]|nr:ferrous iron transport protein B [Clostridia bacterium]
MREVLLVGNPNSGKTTLFNSLTRSNEHVGNWHGVTVENKEKSFFVDGEEFRLVDTPGIYSLCPLSFEEEVAVETIFKNRDKKIINICDQNNLQRNLYLTLCLLERGCDVVLVINEIDKKPIFKVDCEKLGKLLGVDVVLVNAEKKIGLDKLKQCLKKSGKGAKPPKYVRELVLSGEATSSFGLEQYAVIKAYERDEKFFKGQGTKELFAAVPEDSVEILSRLRYQFVEGVLVQCSERTHAVYGRSVLDKVVLNKWLAFPVFLLVLASVFYLTFFSLGALLSDALGGLLNLITTPLLSLAENAFGQSFVFDLFNVAIFGGVGTVLSFLPQVVLLFFFLSVLEDSGYMSRIAFIFEDILGQIGLSGKSVYTLLMGFGCSTSAIMTSRNMEDKNAKIKTAILCPYMSCSAKIPIYTVIGGAFFGANNIFYIIGLYLLGVVVAISISKILEKTALKSKKQSFILEFPPYRMMSFKRVGKVLWKNVKEFLIKVGSVMISMNIIIWLMSSFSFSFSNVAGTGEASMLESIGKFLAPIFTPLGFGNWAIVASLLAGLVAKEVVVSSIAMFNGIDASATKLLSASLVLPTSAVFFASNASVLSFLVFCLLYTPCMASISMLLQEIGKKWTFVSIIIQLVVAYIVSFVTYNLAFAVEIFGVFKVFIILAAVVLMISAFWLVSRRIKTRKFCGNCQSCNKICKRK